MGTSSARRIESKQPDRIEREKSLLVFRPMAAAQSSNLEISGAKIHVDSPRGQGTGLRVDMDEAVRLPTILQ
jgi:hypothetical protein